MGRAKIKMKEEKNAGKKGLSKNYFKRVVRGSLLVEGDVLQSDGSCCKIWEPSTSWKRVRERADNREAGDKMGSDEERNVELADDRSRMSIRMAGREG